MSEDISQKDQDEKNVGGLHKTQVHEKKSKKNLAVLGLIFGFVALIWAVTIIRISSGL